MAFLSTTILLSLLPLGLIGAGIWYTRRSLWASLLGEPTESGSEHPAAPGGAETETQEATRRGED
jgi:hypothetical protein